MKELSVFFSVVLSVFCISVSANSAIVGVNFDSGARYNEVRAIDETEARQMARRLAREEGIFSGTSTGLNVVGALQLAKDLGPGHIVVTVAVDTGLKYLSGDLYQA